MKLLDRIFGIRHVFVTRKNCPLDKVTLFIDGVETPCKNFVMDYGFQKPSLPGLTRTITTIKIETK